MKSWPALIFGRFMECGRKHGWLLVAPLVSTLVVGSILVTARQARAICYGSSTIGFIGTVELAIGAYGEKADIWVNNFDSHQVSTWRDVSVEENSNNSATVGWLTSEALNDQKAHPYKSWVNNGEAGGPVVFSSIDITPRDELHTFAVKDPDDDNDYVFLLDQDQLGVLTHVSIDPTFAYGRSVSWRSCTDDSLWAKFRQLKRLNVASDWVLWVASYKVSTNKAPYQYCKINDHAYDVKQNCD